MPAAFCTSCTRLVLPWNRAAHAASHASERRARSAARRPSRQARGYDGEYDRNRRVVVAAAFSAADDGVPLPCVLCGEPCLRGQPLTAEHLVALRNGGSNDLENLGPAHSGCNTGWNRAKD